MSFQKEYLVESVRETKKEKIIIFYNSLMFKQENIIKSLLQINSKNNKITLDKIIFEYTKYKVDAGYQNTLHGFYSPDDKPTLEFNAFSYPQNLEEGYVPSEMYLTYKINNKKYSLYVYEKTLIISPIPPNDMLIELLTKIKACFYSVKEVTLIIANEFFNAAINDFVSGRYRTAAHNVYYSIYHSVRSLQSEHQISTNKLRHGNVRKLFSLIVNQIQNKTHPLFTEGNLFHERAESFSKLPFARARAHLSSRLDLGEVKKRVWGKEGERSTFPLFSRKNSS